MNENILSYHFVTAALIPSALFVGLFEICFPIYIALKQIPPLHLKAKL